MADSVDIYWLISDMYWLLRYKVEYSLTGIKCNLRLCTRLFTNTNYMKVAFDVQSINCNDNIRNPESSVFESVYGRLYCTKRPGYERCSNEQSNLDLWLNTYGIVRSVRLNPMPEMRRSLHTQLGFLL